MVLPLLVCLTAALVPCTPREIPEGSLDDATDELLLEATCEKNLLYLGRMIQERSAGREIPAAHIVEAKEIYRLAETLYLQREYALAMELIEDAIKMLEGSGE